MSESKTVQEEPAGVEPSKSASGTESVFGSTWQPFSFYFVTPSDTTQIEIFLYAEGGADFQVFDLQIV